MAVYQAGKGPPVVLLHGFPELAFSWRHQLPALSAAGYWAIAPDLRGYGATDKPSAVGDYRMDRLLGDITGLLDAFGISQAVFVGHDWGALLAWQLALVHPDRVHGVICLNIPFLPRGAREPVSLMRERLGNDFYIVNFQDSDEADKCFASDPRRFINNMMRRGQVTRSQFNHLPPERRVISLLATMARDDPGGEPLLDSTELDYYADAFAAGGFTGPINWYRNWSDNWRDSAGIEQEVRVPSLFIGATDDVVVSEQQIEAMRPHVPDLEVHMIDGCGHWTQQEQPDTTNRLMLAWLSRIHR
ncbi:MAG: alpha/beta hydrolase [Woeseiaceae bacterium]|nr:alpha/beta hydrolase [Woeseiaceae bacterium]